MSDFTDFFPVSGGSGVGSGIPINGYFPFTVGGTDNPLGYDVTTGLYTHPDGTFWLKSGNTISSALYPSATKSFGFSNTTFDTNTTTGTATGDIYWTGTEFYVTRFIPVGAVNAVVYVFDSSGNPTGSNITLPNTSNQSFRGLTTDGTDWYFCNRTAPYSIYRFDSTFNAVSITSIASLNIYPEGIAYAGGNFYVVGSTSQGIHELDSSLSPTGNSFSAGMTAVEAIRAGTDGTLWVGGSTGGSGNTKAMKQFTTTGTFLQTVPLTAQTGNNTFGIAWIDASTFWIASTTAGLWNVNLGDGTTRTDSDTSQPLFVRIG